MADFEILRHSASEKFRATGETREKAFEQVINAYAEITRGQLEGMYTHSFEVEAQGLDNLLYDFLEQLIKLQDTENVVISRPKNLEFKEKDTSNYKIKAEVYTDTVTSGMNPLEIKNPTYNAMKTDYEDGEWILEAVLNV